MRPWIKSYTHMITDPQFMRLTAGSRCLWYDSSLWCGLNGSDGIVPADAVKNLKGTASKINGLIEAGFWEEVKGDDGGVAYSIVGWLDEQDSVEKAEKNREDGRNRAAKSRAKSRSSRAQVETKSRSNGEHVKPASRAQAEPEWSSSEARMEPESASSHAQVSVIPRSVELHLNDQKRSDQQEQASVTALEENRREEIRRDETTSEAPGGGEDEQKTETKDGKTITPSPSDSASAPDNSASSSRNQEPVVDTSDTRKEPSDHNPGTFAHLPQEERLEAVLELARQQRREQSA